MQYVAIASSVLSAVGSIQQGKQQEKIYKLQAKQADLKSRRDALQYEQQANRVFERMLQTNATAAARGFSGGVSGFTGSAGLIQQRSETDAGRDIEIMQEGSRAAISFGEIQANMLKEAGSAAVSGGYFDAIGKLGMAAFSYDQVRTGKTPTKAPVEDRSFFSN
jgi:hypothetical protein